MLEYKRIPQEELELVIRNASHKIGVSEVVLEKDYWVCFVLNYLFTQCKWRDALTFKGGTSLSKCYKLIQRFSEDIDLILDWRIIGYSLNEPWEKRSNTKQDEFNKSSNQKTEEFLKNEFLPQMTHDLKKVLRDDFQVRIDEQDPQTILFEYPKLFRSAYITQAVRLEIGALAAWTPSEVIPIEPDLKKVYPMLFEGDYIELRTVLPERTFWEKATILHHEANRPKDRQIPKRYARHYYDIYCIANSEYKDRAFSKPDLLDKVVLFKQKFYPRTWARYEEADVKHIRLMPDAYRLKEIEKDYKDMVEMFFGEYPSFEEILSRIQELENEIHNIE